MGLKFSTVHRKLDAKFKVAGLEALDLLCVLILAATMNLLFGRSSMGPYLVFGLPIALTLVLFFGKRNKPDGYLVHLLLFLMTPGFYSAGEKSKNEEKLIGKIYDK